LHPHRFAVRLSIVFVLAALVSLASASLAAAQSSSPQVLHVNRVAPAVAGNVTFTGIAVDCSTGQPATRVAVYDGPDASAPYVADAAMDTTHNVGSVCGGPTNNARIGFTLIYDSTNLNDGPHMLTFVAQSPNGTTASIGGNVFVDNRSSYGTPYAPPYNNYYPSYPIYPDNSNPGYYGSGDYSPYPDYNANPGYPAYPDYSVNSGSYYGSAYPGQMPGYYGCAFGPYQRADAPRVGCALGGIQPYDVMYGPGGPSLTPDTNDPYLEPWNVAIPCGLCLNPNPGQGTR